MEERGSLENRKCVRVTVPDTLFVEGALWIRPQHAPTRLHLMELGAPQLRFAQGSPLLRIDDLSANGLRLTLARPQGLGEGLAALKSGNCLVFLYIKLHQPLTSVEERPLSLFLGAEPVSLREEENGGIVLTLNILYRGQPNRDEKSMRQGARQGLLLPQVPLEWGWDRRQFLAQTCRKAGLPANAWRDPATQIYWFEAEIF